VWMSSDEGAHWTTLQINLPHTSMRDLLVHEDDLIVATHGRSVWILDNISPLRQFAETPPREAALVTPPPAFRIARSTWTDTPIPPDEPLGENPPSGAVIDYFLPQDAKRPVKLEILDAKGNLVRRFASDDAQQPTAEELERELIPAYWLARVAKLPATRGMHRWIWDLHYPQPDSATRGYPISAVPHRTPRDPQGPLAIPGSYMIHLTVDGRQIEAPLVLKSDPRVTASAEALQEQFELASRLAGLLSESSRILLVAQSERDQLHALAGKEPSTPELAEFDRQLTALLEAKEQPGPDAKSRVSLPEVQSQIDTLYKDVVRSDAAPTAALISTSDAVQRNLEPLRASWEKLQQQLPGLNRKLHSLHLGPLHPELLPPRDLNVADED
jgi:hypothetical protein